EMDTPAMVYYHTKRDAEKKIMESGIPFTILRPSFIIGRGGYFVRQILTDMANGRIIVPSSTDARLQPISIDDTVDAILEAAVNPATNGKIFDLVGPETITIETMVMKVFKVVSDLGVKISPPVIETALQVTADPVWDENYDFLQHDIRGNPGPVKSVLLKRDFRSVDDAIRDAIDEILKPNELVPEKGAVMLLSGGLDSITTLYWARANGYDVHPVSIHYPYRPRREIHAVEMIASALGIHVIEIDAPFLYEVLELKLQGYRVPSIFGASDYYVPYRNLLFNAIATYFADIHGARFIISGHITSDPLPDASEDFFKQLESLVENLKVGDKAVAPKFLLPLKGKTKTDVVRMAIELGVPLKWTWSCAFDGDAPCGKCKPCRERATAFKDAEQLDPVIGFRPTDWHHSAMEN
nr:7-cyano-7-deazaguanine synthase [Candidatus Sigynarchaeota archaeon]